MTHISKKHLPQKELDLLQKRTLTILTKVSDRTAPQFFNAFFTKAECIMLTKRMSAIIMFHEGHTSYRVAHALNMSPSTSDRIKLKYEIGYYDNVIQVFKKDKKLMNVFLDAIEILLSAGLPPQGKGRWRYVLTK